MENSTEIVSFVLSAYGDIGQLRYLYSTVIALWYLCVCAANSAVIAVIYVDRRLHEPMYILLCNLCVSEIGGSTSLYPLMFSQMFSDDHQVSLPWCFLQMSFIYTCASVEFCSLAAMAYDRYVSICYPLHYSASMSGGRVAAIILLIWAYSLVNFLVSLSFTVTLKFCGNVIDKVFCDHHLIIRLACSISLLSSMSDIVFALVTVVLPFGLVLVSYSKILAVCLITSRENKQKAIATCTPQLVSLSNMFVATISHFVDSRLDAEHIPSKVRVVLSVYLLLCQPMITPFLYGFKLPKIKESCRKVLFDRK